MAHSLSSPSNRSNWEGRGIIFELIIVFLLVIVVTVGIFLVVQ